jgi:hypothetical protein
MFYVDILNTDYTFYYNMLAQLNENVSAALRKELLSKFESTKYLNANARAILNSRQNITLDKTSYGQYGVMTNYNAGTGSFEYVMASEMQGICATIKNSLAVEIVERAKYYCPVDTGRLINSFRIEEIDNDRCIIYNDCPYAWYVEEFTWKNHEYPKSAKFLTKAVYEISKKYGLYA